MNPRIPSEILYSLIGIAALGVKIVEHRTDLGFCIDVA